MTLPATKMTGFDTPWDPVSSQGMMAYAVSVEDLLNGLYNGTYAWRRQLMAAASTLTINGSGELAAPTLQQHTVSANSGTSDDLDRIEPVDGAYLILGATSGHTIRIRHGVDNLYTLTTQNLILTGNRLVLLFGYDGGWSVIGGARAVNNTSSIVDPGSADDESQNYSLGSVWINTTHNRAWMCTDATATAAAWQWISPPKNEWIVRATAGDTVAGDGAAASVGGAGGTTTLDADGTWLSLTSAVVGTPATIYSGTAPNLGQTRWNYEPVWETLIKTGGDLTSQRLWVALIDSAGVVDADTLTNPALAFRYSTVAGDARFRPIAFDGTTQKTGDPIGPVLAINTVYKLRMRVAAQGAVTVYFSVNDSEEETVTTNLPLNTQDLVLHIAMYPQAAASRSLLFGQTWVAW